MFLFDQIIMMIARCVKLTSQAYIIIIIFIELKLKRELNKTFDSQRIPRKLIINIGLFEKKNKKKKWEEKNKST